MGLVEKFQDRLDKAKSIEKVEAIAVDLGNARGLTADEREKISRALETRFEELSEEPESREEAKPGSLDEAVEELGTQVLQELQREPGKPLDRAAVVVRDMAEKYDLPPGFILTFEDPQTGRITPYVTKPGLLYKLKQVGFRTVQVRYLVEDDEAQTYECEAAIYPNLSMPEIELLSKILDKGDRSLFREVHEELTRPTIARGTANPRNLKEKQLKYAKEMAETRATLRACRMYTGCGLYLEEELEG